MADSPAPVDESLELTGAERRVLQALIRVEPLPMFSFDVMKTTSLGSGAVDLALFRLERAGWLAKGVQERGQVVPAQAGRWFPPRFPSREYTLPPRTWWKLTSDGIRLARTALDDRRPERS